MLWTKQGYLGLKSAVYNQERVMMERIRYVPSSNLSTIQTAGYNGTNTSVYQFSFTTQVTLIMFQVQSGPSRFKNRQYFDV